MGRILSQRHYRWAGWLGILLGTLATVAMATEPVVHNVGFDRLAAFPFEPPRPEHTDEASARAFSVKQIPQQVNALNGEKVAVTGYMLPVRLVGGRVVEFLLVRDPSMCCYGVVPNMNEWVIVKMTGAGVAPLLDVPVVAVGQIKVGPQFENGYLTGIYELKGDRVAAAES